MAVKAIVEITWLLLPSPDPYWSCRSLEGGGFFDGICYYSVSWTLSTRGPQAGMQWCSVWLNYTKEGRGKVMLSEHIMLSKHTIYKPISVGLLRDQGTHLKKQDLIPHKLQAGCLMYLFIYLYVYVCGHVCIYTKKTKGSMGSPHGSVSGCLQNRGRGTAQHPFKASKPFPRDLMPGNL